MNLALKILQESKEKGKYLSIWNYNDDEKFWFGKILNFTEEIVVLQHFTKYGKKDGLLILQICDIKAIDFDDEYTNAMKLVIENSEKLATEDEFKFDFYDNENWKFILLNQLKFKTEIITSIEIENDYFTGFIKDVDEENFVINLVGSLGQDEGNSIYKIEDLKSFRVNDIDNRKRLLLYNSRK
ncbi:hypothetical protein SAMN05421847_0392 [Halpernia humi]|uniref:Uncharacterized protein n=1 Tax=Halpernia humi TaxID=493375 RepID=A0A1H5T7L5_9FLAO|nr:hypothetical protein [Halpernia humi]SEF58832.1 hypothetical protein SAMN05421847_0392 [Halpernia humi]